MFNPQADLLKNNPQPFIQQTAMGQQITVQPAALEVYDLVTTVIETVGLASAERITQRWQATGFTNQGQLTLRQDTLQNEWSHQAMSGSQVAVQGDRQAADSPQGDQPTVPIAEETQTED